MRWRNRVLCTIAAAAALTMTGFALAAPSPESLQRSLETFTEWTGSPARDIQDFGLGQYQFEAQVEGGARRAIDSASTRYTPDRLTDPASRSIELQKLYDSILHDRPNPPDSGVQETADPDLLPDWNGNNTYGEAGRGLDRGDYDLDLDQHRDAAWFRYPVFHDDGTVTHTEDRGAAIEAGFVNSRGLFIDATLWLPSDMVAAVDADTDEVSLGGDLSPHPALVFSNGISSSQIMYYWFAESMAARGYIVLTYDPAGQGQSDGTWSDTFQQRTGTGDCYFGGACLDVQDAMRWLVGQDIAARDDLQGLSNGQLRPFSGPRSSTYDDQNPKNPYWDLVDPARVGLAGNSMGALATLNYLTAVHDGVDLPPLKAAVAMSGATPSAAAPVPLQLQTADFDGSPTLVGPGVGGVSLGGMGQGIGYYPIKEMFDRLVSPSPENDMSLMVMEGGVHTDHTRVPYVPRTTWATRLASQYAGDWFDCYVRGQGDACGRSRSTSAHLSKAFGSEYRVFDGDRTCIGAPPTDMSLNYDAQDLAALRPRDCLGRVGAGNG